MTTNEQSSDRAVSEVTKTFFRRAHGAELSGLLDGLDPYCKSDQRFEVPTDPDNNVSPRVQLIKSKELFANKDALLRSGFAGKAIFDRLVSEVPTMTEPKNVAADRLQHVEARNGSHFLCLRLNQSSAEEIASERADMWDVLEEITGGELLDWNDYTPDLKVAHMSADPKPAATEMLLPVKEQIRGLLAIEFSLDPVVDPTAL